jgi:hypothetical protein
MMETQMSSGDHDSQSLAEIEQKRFAPGLHSGTRSVASTGAVATTTAQIVEARIVKSADFIAASQSMSVVEPAVPCRRAYFLSAS